MEYVWEILELMIEVDIDEMESRYMNLSMSLKEITTFLNSRTSNPEFDNLEEIKEWFGKLELTDWGTFVSYTDENYCRVPLHICERFDLLLVCWNPGQGTNYHTHP